MSRTPISPPSRSRTRACYEFRARVADDGGEVAAIQGNRNPYIDQPDLVGHMPFAAAMA